MSAWFGFAWRVALRFLREGRLQTLLILVGVAFGVAVIAYISALVSGLQTNTFNKTIGGQAHVSVRALDDTLASSRPAAPGETLLGQAQPRAQRLRSVANWQALAPVLGSLPQVAAVSPIVAGAGLALRGEATQSVAISGIELDAYDRVARLREKIVSGEARLSPGDAIIGVELATDLGLRPGDRFMLRSGAVAETLRVSALADMGVRELNRRVVFVPLHLAQSLLDLVGGATSLDLALHDPWIAQDFARELRAVYPYRIESWQETNAQLVSALSAQSMSTGMIRAVVLVVVVLGIASVLVVSVVQKRREIGILRAMGATRAQMLGVFLLQGALFGAVGSVVGLALAQAMITAFTAFVRGSDGLPLFVITLNAGLVVEVAVVATVCGVLAAIAPARRAASLDPAQAIRL
jgi:lipoprotein-releasing system permease protein